MCIICAVQNKKDGGYGCADVSVNVDEAGPGPGGFGDIGQLPGSDTVIGGVGTTHSIGLNNYVRGYVNSNGDQDWYRVNLTNGQTYTFAQWGIGLGALEDTYLRIYNSAGTLVASDDDSGPLRNSLLTFVANATGSFYISAGAFGTNTGQYMLTAATGSNDFTPNMSVTDIADQIQYGYWGQNDSGPREWASSNQNVSYNLTGLSAARQTIARLAFATWGEISGLTFAETTGAAEITLDDTQSGAFANTTFSGGSDTAVGTITSASINVETGWFGGSSAMDSYTFQTFIHEIGHTLGLGHGGPYNGSATYGTDNVFRNDYWQNTIMSYMDQGDAGTGSYRFTMTPMMADILAIHRMYGAEAARTGNTIYGHGGNAPGLTGAIYNFANYTTAPSFTIYDSGGIDTLNASLYTENQVIDLRGGYFSNIGGLTRNIGIYTTSVIERGYGGSGNDSMIGNSASNVLSGNNGNDTLQGLTGNDSLLGGNGNDLLIGGGGNDSMYGGNNDDRFRFTAASDSPASSPAGTLADRVQDFDDFGNDWIDLSQLPGTLTYRGTFSFTGINQVRISDIAGPDLLVLVNLSGSTAPEMEIRLVNTPLALITSSDFLL